jgi:hypothetical protein
MKPGNFVEEVNGHQIYRAEKEGRFNLFTVGVGWWGFDLTEEEARTTCAAVSSAENTDGDTRRT